MSDDNQSPGEAVSHLAGLLTEAEALEGAGAAQALEVEQAQQVQQARQANSTAVELLAALKMARGMARVPLRWWEDFDINWSDDVLSGIAENLSVIMIQNGWTVAQAMGRIMPYVGLIAVTAPPAHQTWLAVKARKAAIEAGQEVGES